MPNFRYRALTQAGEVVTGSISASDRSRGMRIASNISAWFRSIPSPRNAPTQDCASALDAGPRPEDVTVFTLDLALLLKAGARLDDALELLTTDIDIGRLRPVVAGIRASILSGESFGDAISRHTSLFTPMYVALVRVGEASGTLDQILEMLASERARAEALRRRLADALRYPAFVLFAAACVLVFFLMFVLPQFAAVLRDFGAKLDPIVVAFISLSDFLRAHADIVLATLGAVVLGGWLLLATAQGPRAIDYTRLRALSARSAPSRNIIVRHCSAAISAYCLQAASRCRRRFAYSPT